MAGHSGYRDENGLVHYDCDRWGCEQEGVYRAEFDGFYCKKHCDEMLAIDAAECEEEMYDDEDLISPSQAVVCEQEHAKPLPNNVVSFAEAFRRATGKSI